MFFNVQKNGSRNLIDTGDLKQYLMKLTISDKRLDKITLAVIADIITYLENSFNEPRPGVLINDKVIYPLEINDYYLNRRINEFLKKNKKVSSLDIDMSDELPEAPAVEFNEKQLIQFEEALNKQTEELLNKIKTFYLNQEKKENKGSKSKS